MTSDDERVTQRLGHCDNCDFSVQDDINKSVACMFANSPVYGFKNSVYAFQMYRSCIYWQERVR